MATILKSGERVEVIAAIGFTTLEFTLDASLLDGDDVLDGTIEGIDIAPYIQSLSISRGRSSQLDQFSAGRLSMTLVNNDRRFDPINELSPYYDVVQGRSGIVPRRKITVKLNGLSVFTGRLADIDVNYNFKLSTVTMTAVDDFVLLASTFTTDAFTPTEQLSGARVTTILDRAEVAYPVASRNIATGTTTLGAYQVSANTNVLSYLQQCAEAESGLFFVAADGDLTFTDRIFSIFVPPIITSFTDAGGGIPYQALDVIYGQEFLYNRIQVTRNGGVLQSANNLTSQTEFGISTYALDNMLLSTDTQAQQLADSLLAQFSEPVYRFDGMAINLNMLSDIDRDVVNTTELGVLIEITRTYDVGSPASVTQYYTVESIKHTITPGVHTVRFGLRFPQIIFPFTLDDSVFGVLDTDNALL
jgi:small nuclear ribonucleoprotein (snRNP)-like protein